MSPDKVIHMQFCFKTQLEVEAVLYAMRTLVIKNNVVTVQDLHDLIGMDSTYKDAQHGWDDLDLVGVEQAADGAYVLLNLPGPKALS